MNNIGNNSSAPCSAHLPPALPWSTLSTSNKIQEVLKTNIAVATHLSSDGITSIDPDGRHPYRYNILATEIAGLGTSLLLYLMMS